MEWEFPFFGFTKPQNKELFCSMGMYPVTQTEKILLLENDKTDWKNS